MPLSLARSIKETKSQLAEQLILSGIVEALDLT
jgi:hypothetical protein